MIIITFLQSTHIPALIVLNIYKILYFVAARYLVSNISACTSYLNLANLTVDRSIALFRVYLLGHHVLSIFILRPWSCSGFDPNCRGRWPCLVHFFGCMGILPETPRGSRRLRYWPDAILGAKMGLVRNSYYVSIEQHIHPGKLPSC